MKRLSAVVIMLICLAILVGCKGNAPDTDGEKLIGETEAKRIALDHAGLTEDEVTFIRANLDLENGRQVYDVEFYAGQNEYDYEIDAYTADIASFDADVEDYVGTDTTAAATEEITLDEAKSIALVRANLADAEVTYTEAETDFDDGRKVYQIDFIYDNTEYELEIDAISGEILEYNSESVYD